MSETRFFEDWDSLTPGRCAYCGTDRDDHGEGEACPEVCEHCGRPLEGRTHWPQGGYCIIAPIDGASGAPSREADNAR